MTVEELISQLEDLDPNLEVRFAAQPRWPFEYSIKSVVEVELEEEVVVYLEEGNQLGYLPKEASDALDW